jgi:hypothetical protein
MESTLELPKIEERLELLNIGIEDIISTIKNITFQNETGIEY